jgi:hypothetical protein
VKQRQRLILGSQVIQDDRVLEWGGAQDQDPQGYGEHDEMVPDPEHGPLKVAGGVGFFHQKVRSPFKHRQIIVVGVLQGLVGLGHLVRVAAKDQQDLSRLQRLFVFIDLLPANLDACISYHVGHATRRDVTFYLSAFHFRGNEGYLSHG